MYQHITNKQECICIIILNTFLYIVLPKSSIILHPLSLQQMMSKTKTIHAMQFLHVLVGIK